MAVNQARYDDARTFAYKEEVRARLRQHSMIADFKRLRLRNGSLAIYVGARSRAGESNWFEGHLGRLDTLAEMTTEDFDALIASKREEQLQRLQGEKQ